LIEGHTDNVGNENHNKILSENRAKSVYDYLISKGISADRIEYKGLGEARPIADNNIEDGKARNRRTSFRVTSN